MLLIPSIPLRFEAFGDFEGAESCERFDVWPCPMVWCAHCKTDVTAEDDYQAGYSCCPLCGAVLVEGTYENAISFGEEGGMIGQILSDEKKPQQGGGTSERGFHEISLLVDQLRIHPRDDTIDAALRLYKMAVHRGFLKGRRSSQVAACCIYIMCRTDKRPYLLIDFSDALRVNVYVLGCVFLDLCYLFKLDEHPIVLSPVDPSLFIHRYVDRLNFGGKASAVTQSTLKLIKSMNRDWIQTGRKPSGICAAALFIASHMHNVPKMKRDIIYVARIGVSTVAKRLTEFSKTKPGKLNAEEFHQEALKMEKMEQALLTHPIDAVTSESSSRCHHLENGAGAFACGMCRNCYLQYLTISGGIFEGTADPPAFVKNVKKRTMSVGRIFRLANDLEVDEEERRVLDQEMREAPAVEEVEAEMDNALSSEQLHPLLQTPTEDWSSLVETPVSRPVIPPETPCRPSSGPVGEALLGFNQEEEFEEDLPFDDEEDDMPVDDIRGLSPFLLPIPSPSAAATVGAVIEVDMLEDITEEDIADYILPPEEGLSSREHLKKAALRKERPVEKDKKRRRSVKKARTNPQEYSSAFEAVKGMLEEKGLSSKINYDNLEALFAEGSEETAAPAPATPQPPRNDKKESFFLRSLSFRKAERRPKKRLDGLFD